MNPRRRGRVMDTIKDMSLQVIYTLLEERLFGGHGASGYSVKAARLLYIPVGRTLFPQQTPFCDVLEKVL